ncbi:MAG TPA: hypothetical protein PKM57_13310 [Kiritimatiellia bacterium]|nr:hypothetical protein [Kiritimatiellia bacterium]HPS07507.1 hypothetical protein [Kiritimatiellia bacterium]
MQRLLGLAMATGVCWVAALFGDTGAWNADGDGRWSDASNWAANIVAGGSGSTAYFTNSVAVRRTVTVDCPVTVEALRFGSPTNNNWRLVGPGPVALDGVSKPRIGSSLNQKVEIFTPLAGTNGFVQESLPGDIELAGVNRGVGGIAEVRAYTVVQTMSKTAESQDAVVRDYFPTGGVIMAGARLELLGRKNGSTVASDWALTEGDARVRSASTNATVNLAPGQTVSGTGVPSGTFIWQILDGSNLVLSAVAVQSATSTLSFAAAAFRSEQLLQRVRVDGSQDFRVHRNGGASFTAEVERVYGTANWALKSGDAVVKIPGQREHFGAIQLHSVDLTLAPKTVTRQPARGAAFHVDASQSETLTLDGSTVTEWRDVNGNGIAARPPGANKPTLMPHALNGKSVVDFGTFGVSPYMHWYNAEGQIELANVRAVFWVFGSQNGGGFLLGATNTAHFHRGNHPAGIVAPDAFYPILTSSQLWDHDWNTYPGGGRVETYIDGIRRDKTAALNGGYQVIACMISTNVTAGGFATDRNSFSNRRGGQRLAEVIIYERPLTEQERIETEEYLMSKWFGDTRWDAGGGAPSVTELNALGTRVVNAPDTGETTLGHLTGSGKLTKNGAGTLAITDAQDYLGALSLAGGGLKLTAAAIPSAPASNAYFHVDASVTNSFTLDGGGRVLTWRDWRGNGLEASVQEGFARPARLLNTLNGLPVVDFGALGSLQALSWNHTNNGMRAVFLVFHSLSPSAQLLGGVTNQAQDFYRGAGGQLYNTDATASRAVVYGANYVNGWRVEPMVATLPSAFCVVSVIPTTDARASAFALDRYFTARTGGQRLAEVIVYNRTLADRERRDTEAYLMRKWLGRVAPGYGAADMPQLPSLSFAGASLSVQVDGDGAAAIGLLSGGGDVVKTGSGTLAMGNGGLGFAGAVRVAEGAVSATTADAGAAAACPVFHVDASQTNTMTFAEENGTNFITRWKSLGTASNAAVERAGYRRPYLLTNDVVGALPAVGFGPFGTDGSCLKWETAVATARSVFLVLGSQEGGGFLLGSTIAAHFHRGNRGSTFLPITKDNVMFGWDVSANVYNGAVYLDGLRVASPTAQTLSGGYQLIEILTTDNTTADLFAGDRDSCPGRGGGQRLAEVLIYDRLLTERERQQTENYLNRKWFGRSAAGAGFGTVSVEDGAEVSAEVVPLVVNRLLGVGTIVKSGSDTLTLSDTTGFTGTVEVTGGALNLAVPAAPLAPPSNTHFWVDAAKAGTIDTDASGLVLQWRDATGNGRYATPVPGRYPTLRGNDFAGLPTVDMGPYGSTGSSGMYWNQRLTGLRTLIWVMGSQMSGGYLLGATNGTPFHRGPAPEGGEIMVTNFTCRNYMLSGSWGATLPTSAYTNGVAVNTTTTGLSGGYQTLFMTWSGGTYADGFAFDRTIGDRYGGQRVAEFIAYDRVLTDAERLAADAYLDRKWFGKTTGGYAQPATRTGVILHEGTALTMNGSSQTVTALSGSGAVSNGTLVVLNQLSPGLFVADCVTLPVGGSLTLADGVTFEADYARPDHDQVAVSGTLTVSGGGTFAVRLPEPPGTGLEGRVAVMTFGTIEGVPRLASWTVTGLPSAYKGALVVEGQTVYLEIRTRGTILLLR